MDAVLKHVSDNATTGHDQLNVFDLELGRQFSILSDVSVGVKLYHGIATCHIDDLEV